MIVASQVFWENGEYWWAVPLVAGLAALAAFSQDRWRRRTARALADANLIGLIRGQVSDSGRLLATVFFLSGLLLAGIAFLRPQWGSDQSHLKRKGIDLAVALDVSNSMLTPDVEPNRLYSSVLEIEELMKRMRGGRVALVPFAGMAFVQTPLTSDFGAVGSYLRNLRPVDLPVPGTAIGKALELSLSALGVGRVETDADGVSTPYKGSKFKVVLLVTDGEDHGGNALELAKKAAEMGIRVFTVGVGSVVGDIVPETNSETGKVTAGRMVDKETGDPVVSHLNEELLKQIATESGGKYFAYTGQPIAAALYSEIDRLEKKEIQDTLSRLRKDRFQFLLVPALVLFLLAMAVPAKRRSGHEK